MQASPCLQKNHSSTEYKVLAHTNNFDSVVFAMAKSISFFSSISSFLPFLSIKIFYYMIFYLHVSLFFIINQQSLLISRNSSQKKFYSLYKRNFYTIPQLLQNLYDESIHFYTRNNIYTPYTLYF